MPPFVVTELMLGAAILAISFLHLALAWKQVRPTLNAIFALVGCLVAVGAFSAPHRYLSDNIPGIILGIKLSLSAMLAYAGALVWFAREFAGLRSKVWPMAATLAAGTSLVCHIFMPYSSRFSIVTSVRSAPLIGGGTMFFPVGQLSPVLFIGHIAAATAIGYLIFAAVVLWRDPARRRRAASYTLGIAPLVLFAYPHGILVNRGVIDSPYFYTFAFLGLILLMSETILNDTVQSIALSREVQLNERRWKTLLENVSLLVIQTDREGRIAYANPYLLKTTGYSSDAILGRPFSLLFPEKELPRLHEIFEQGLHGNATTLLQTGLVTKAKQRREVYWSNVLLTGANGEVTGVVSVGADITSRVDAEKARDEAMAQLAALKERLEAENQYLRLEQEESAGAMDIIGESDAMRYVRHKIAQVAGTDTTVLIEGETGVGKELVARAIHNSSPRANMAFVRVNCAALPATLVESELFGHERGAFTGADRARQGRFELAEGGTLLLDEIGELPLEIQVKLLRVLQEGEYDRVGGTKTRKTNVRVIASTNRHLPQDVASGRFREDLYYRLQVFPITVPPLRDRRDDIPLLVHHTTRRICARHGRPVPEISMGLIRQLTEFDWPGNVRELQNVLERAVITSSKHHLTLPSDFGARKQRPGDTNGHSEEITLDAVERRHIEKILRQTKGQIAGAGGAAEILGLHPNTLRGRMAKLGVNRGEAAASAGQ